MQGWHFFLSKDYLTSVFIPLAPTYFINQTSGGILCCWLTIANYDFLPFVRPSDM